MGEDLRIAVAQANWDLSAARAGCGPGGSPVVLGIR